MHTYYGELCTKIYESDKSMAAGKELDFYLSFAKDKNMKVLEPMCGNGRMLIPFMQNGIDIEGFDLSVEMLKMCKEKAEQLNLKPVVSQERIEKFHGNKKYDLIMIPIGSFSLLPDNLVDISLQNMKNNLNENGKFLLTVVLGGNEVEEILDWIETNRKEINNELIVEYRKVSYDDVQKLLNIKLKYEIIHDEKIVQTEIMDFPIRLYDLKEFENILIANGFNQVVIHEIKDGYGEGNSFHVFECSI
ncbi:SAM-dependent methyltransferase [Bacillus cereus]|uniref:SAM-dependent methyltransferase n=1 Tax=Bacillus cereus TaxID=1396 RepID=A0A2A8LUN4_BACCE|nr:MULTISPECIES: class I SAM-dependent methyltransferase [Bacillus cereus group]MDR4984573.1 class I SAM-dependent methyltransferase [Bacillus cereus]PES98082.1 SAM-dependent methyltransferase [Bacillus cereus]PFP82524.1 SAM-dependent methyltransferase [Bacillus cereus]PGT20442.1 SAM-dependent methyltransferase [Bacillus cereus]